MRMDQEGQQVIKNPVHSVLVRDRQQNVYWLRAHVHHSANKGVSFFCDLEHVEHKSSYVQFSEF